MENKEYQKIDYVDSEANPRTEYVKIDQVKTKTWVEPAEKEGMIANKLIGICTNFRWKWNHVEKKWQWGQCGLMGTVVFPVGFNFKTVDRIEDFKPTKVKCPACRKETEFLPVNTKKIPDSKGWKMIRRFQNDIFSRGS